jgi:hypothetical protein
MRWAAVLAAVVAAIAAGCGSRSRGAETGTTSVAATHSSAGTRTTSTAASTTTSITPATTKVATTGMAPREVYEARMQARIDVVAAQCYSPDPRIAARQAVARYRQALAQLEAIKPPADAAHAHGELIAVVRIYVAAAEKRVAPSEKLAAMTTRARADGHVSRTEQAQIRQRQQELLRRYAPPRSAARREGDALRELRRKGFDVEPKGPSKADYVRRVQALVDAAGNPTKSFRTTTSSADLRAQLRRRREAAWRAARTLDDITPPDKVSYAQQQLVGALCNRGRLFDDITTALARRATPQLVRFGLVSGRDADRIGGGLYRSAIVEYGRAGYRVRPAVGPPR